MDYNHQTKHLSSTGNITYEIQFYTVTYQYNMYLDILQECVTIIQKKP